MLRKILSSHSVKLVLERKINSAMFHSILVEGNTPKHTARDIVREFALLPKCEVKKIFIRKVPGYESLIHPKVKPLINLFDHYLEPAMYLFEDNALGGKDIFELIKKINEFRGDTYKELLSIILRFNSILSEEKNSYSIMGLPITT